MSGNHKHTTVPEHMASSHRRYAGWTIGRIRQDAAAIPLDQLESRMRCPRCGSRRVTVLFEVPNQPKAAAGRVR
jgi:DNA-directed RNA polymerase subunit RPC12/RpoP